MIDNLEVGGAQHHLLALAGGLRNRGYTLTVLTTGRDALATSFEAAGIPVIAAGSRPIKRRVSRSLTQALTRLAWSGRFDLIHSHLYGASVAGAMAASRNALPLAVTQHSVGSWQGAAEGALRRWSYQRADIVIGVSQEIVRRLEGDGITAHAITNGVASAAPESGPQELAALRARMGMPPSAFVVGYVGRLVDDKNPLLFAEVAAIVAQRCPRVHFLVAGDGALRGDLMARVQTLGLEDRFTFAGFVQCSVSPSLFDVLVLTSRSEGSPLAVLEAMAAGRPVVATAVGDVARQVEHGSTGFLAPPGDLGALARKVMRLADPELRSRFGANSRARVARHFALDRMVESTAALYEHLLANRFSEAGKAARYTPDVPSRSQLV